VNPATPVARFRILGPIEVASPDGPSRVHGPRQLALLALLIVHANRRVSVDLLIDALWRDHPAEGAVKRVHVAVRRLRTTLDGVGQAGPPGPLRTVSGGYLLAIEPGELDTDLFRALVHEGQVALDEGRAVEAALPLRRGLAMWRGPPLADVAFEEFAQAEIRRLEQLRREAAELAIDADLAAGRHHEALAEIESLMGEWPLRERPRAQHMLALYRSGRQAEALAAFHELRRILLAEVGIEPGPGIRELHEAILRQDPALDVAPAIVGRAHAPLVAVPARVTAGRELRLVRSEPASEADEAEVRQLDVPRVMDAPRRSRLSVPSNRTIGLGREVEGVCERLRAGSVRLLTLTGPGGVGKTRLALEAARRVEADFADGAYFVSLDSVRRSQDVPMAIATALEVVLMAGECPGDAVKRFLADRRVLLVIDNVEHVLGAAPFIGELLASSPGVTVLATSREALALHAEERRPVPPLAVPPAGGVQDAAAPAGADAVALFCERARARDPEFELEAGNASAVASICRRLDGLPLAIELAAARCGLLSAVEIAGRLDATVDVLGAGARDAPARQQTLWATIDWSHELLSAEQRACFARFAVFAGGATVPAAESITGAGLDTLDLLVAKSLLVRKRQADATTRLAMLETVRAYAYERLAATPDHDEVRERHSRHFVALAERCGSEHAQHLALLDADVDNLRAALSWAVAQPTPAPALALAAALGDPYR
jgi:predicted ATPase/DNA-binding SARP family transcriptional activator